MSLRVAVNTTAECPRTVYTAPLHNQAQTSWCTWHHRTSILRVVGVYGTTAQPGSD